MPRIWSWKFAIKAARTVYACLLGMILVIVPFDLWEALTAPHTYPFGMEGPVAGVWAYRSQANYVIAGVAMWGTSGMALWALFAQRASRFWRCLGSMPFLLLWAFNAFDGSPYLT